MKVKTSIHLRTINHARILHYPLRLDFSFKSLKVWRQEAVIPDEPSANSIGFELEHYSS